MAAQPIVRVSNLFKAFKRGSEVIEVLIDLNLEVPEGEFLALMGPSGSGKTTLLNLIAGLDSPSSGVIEVGSRTISNMSEGQLAKWRTRNVGFVFQFYHLLPVLTAYENVELPLLLLPLSAADRRKQVLNALDLVGLSDRLWHRPGQLSGGQQQRVGIARAIVADPTLIVADEPTGDLDARSAEEILNLLVELKNALQKTIIMVTHDPRAAVRAERVLHLDKGQLVREAFAGTVGFNDPSHPVHHDGITAKPDGAAASPVAAKQPDAAT
jgi:putative ABC transport system ATP-binding protein